MDKARRRSGAYILGGVLAAAGGIGLQVFRRGSGKDTAAIDNLWTWPLQTLEGELQPLARWRGSPLIVNFWATWCEPCRVEMPLLVRTHQKYAPKGLQIVGISIDSAAKVQEFAKEYKVAYPLLIAGLDVMEIARNLGNQAAGLPYTVVLDRDGHIQARHLGGISETELEAAIAPVFTVHS